MDWILKKIERSGPMTASDLMKYRNIRRDFVNAACLHATLDRMVADGLITAIPNKPRTGRPTVIYTAKGNP